MWVSKCDCLIGVCSKQLFIAHCDYACVNMWMIQCIVTIVLCNATIGPANVPPNQHFKKNFPSLEEREARGTKRTITNELHHDSVPFNEMDNMSS